MPNLLPVDLRSDTVTRPTPEMRAAMAAAEVGDDVFREDPTVRRLEERAAELMGKEAALFVASGCMANLVCVMAQIPAGGEIVLGEMSHMRNAESGAYARFAQVKEWPLPTDKFGNYDPARLAAAIHVGCGLPGGNPHRATTRLLCLENTNNYCGGTVQTPALMSASVQAARSQAPWIKVHLDGARIFNAAVALGIPARELAAVSDSVCFCVSKGLSSPVGSLVCGSRDFVTEALGCRKMLGGGMRQVGVLAACGLVSVSEPMIARLAEDHVNCRRLAEGLAELPGVKLDLETVQTNILYLTYRGPKGDSEWLLRALNAAGVRCLVVAGRIRMVTHREVSRAQVDEALRIARHLVTGA
jgi:threonine aldolase